MAKAPPQLVQIETMRATSLSLQATQTRRQFRRIAKLPLVVRFS
jgi:hypothetical protein